MARRPSSLGRRWACYRPALSGCGTQSGGSTFTPLSLPGLVSWHDASRAGSLWQDSARTTPATADADPVGAWDDLSGNGNHLIQATAGKRPQLKLTGGAAGVGGRRLLFDGVDDFLGVAGLNLGTSHMMCVLSTRSGVANAYVMTGRRVLGWASIISGFAGDFEYYDPVTRVVIAATDAAATGFHSACAGGNPSGVTSRIDGAAGASAATAAGFANDGIDIGSNNGGSLFGGSISEVIAFSSYSAANLVALDAYLNGRR